MPNHPSSVDPVELLLRRIAQRCLAGSLFATAATVSGCAVDANRPDTDGDDQGLGDREISAPTSHTPASSGSEAATASSIVDAGLVAPGVREPLDAGRRAVDAGTIDIRGFTPLTCAPNSTSPLNAAGLTLREPVDYVAIRERSGLRHEGEDAGTDVWSNEVRFRTLSEAGEPCKTAMTPACSENVRGHPTQFVTTRCLDFCLEQSIVTTRGDEVRRYAGETAIAQLGEIDTAAEAVLAVYFAGYSPSCTDPKIGGVRAVDEGFEVLAARVTSDCAPVITTAFRLLVARNGSVKALERAEYRRIDGLCAGRMAAHLRLQDGDVGSSALGDYLAHSAQLEAASVYAFEQLARELEAHGAPADLVARARAACEDEIRHAEEVGALAIARGGVPAAPSVYAQDVRGLEEIAIENAVEGCVRETYGALVGAYQAAKASDHGLRRAMVNIAADEARHAALSHALHAWILGKLDADGRARVRAAQARAIDALRAAAGEEPDAMLRERAGLPDAVTALTLIDQLAWELWLPESKLLA